jgi:hypothetical protein
MAAFRPTGQVYPQKQAHVLARLRPNGPGKGSATSHGQEALREAGTWQGQFPCLCAKALPNARWAVWSEDAFGTRRREASRLRADEAGLRHSGAYCLCRRAWVWLRKAIGGHRRSGTLCRHPWLRYRDRQESDRSMATGGWKLLSSYRVRLQMTSSLSPDQVIRGRESS